MVGMKLTPSRVIWFNGELIPWEKATVHVLTHALHYGSSVFEGLRAYKTRQGTAVLGLDEHVERLLFSCKVMNLPLAWNADDIAKAIRDTVRANGHEACYIRPLVYRGYGALGVWPDENPVELAIATFPWELKLAPGALEKGIELGVSSWRRPAPDTHPTMAKIGGNYVNSMLIVMEAKRHGYNDGIALDVDGYVSEGSGQNLFLAMNDTLYTAPVGASILAGFTRGAVITLAKALGIPVVEQRIAREMLYAADEVFLTGTVAEITPARAIDGKQVGSGARGPLCERIQQRFFATLRGDIEDRHRWLTPV